MRNVERPPIINCVFEQTLKALIKNKKPGIKNDSGHICNFNSQLPLLKILAHPFEKAFFVFTRVRFKIWRILQSFQQRPFFIA